MSIILFDPEERAGLSREDLELLHQYILQQIQTNPEIRDIITTRAFLNRNVRIKRILRDRANPLRLRLTEASAGRGRKKKGGRKRKR